MIGLVITGHGDLPFALGTTLEHIFGPLTHIRAVSINPDDNLDMKRKELDEALQHVKKEAKGAIIATDLFGGTPSNLAMGHAEGGEVDVLCGVNLPLLVKFIEMRKNNSLQDVSVQAQEAGIEHIKRASFLLSPLKEKRI